MKVATLEIIREVYPHGGHNLDIVRILNFECVVEAGAFKVGEEVIFFHNTLKVAPLPFFIREVFSPRIRDELSHYLNLE